MGDTRGYIIMNESGKITLHRATDDHTPENKGEKARVLRKGGTIRSPDSI